MDQTGGTNTDCFVIAEAGVNHNGNLDTAKELIEAGAVAGVDAVKFQTFDADRLLSRDTETAEYQKRSGNTNQYEMIKSLELAPEDFGELNTYRQDHGVEFLSTAYDRTSVEILEEIGGDRYKIASVDLINKPLLRAVVETGRPLIFSTGMASLGEIERSVEWCQDKGCGDLTLLHCVSCYPTAPEQVNMRFMETLRTTFDVPVGFSDHTLGTAVGIMAASRGVTVIEKHFTLDRSIEGPDHFASL